MFQLVKYTSFERSNGVYLIHTESPNSTFLRTPTFCSIPFVDTFAPYYSFLMTLPKCVIIIKLNIVHVNITWLYKGNARVQKISKV